MVSSGAIERSDDAASRDSSFLSDRLEVLEGLTAGGAVADRTASGRSERVVQARPQGAAERARDRRLEDDERKAGRGGAGGGREPAPAQRLVARRRDPVRGPRDGEDEPHVDRPPE